MLLSQVDTIPQRQLPHPLPLPPECDFLLLEVPPLLLVYQNQVQVVPDRKLLVDVPHGGGEVVSSKEDPDGNTLPPDWRPVHYLVLGYCLVLVEGVGPAAGRLTFYNRDLHVLDLDSHQKKVNFPDNNALEVVLRLVVLELYV